MTARWHESETSRARRLSQGAVKLVGALVFTLMAATAAAIDVCTLKTVFVGYLYHGETGLPAPFDTVCYTTSCQGNCFAEPWTCGYCAVADLNGRYEYTTTVYALRMGDIAGGLGGHLCITGRSSCRAPACGWCVDWDGADFPCPQPYFILDTSVGDINVDLFTSPLLLPTPANLYPPDGSAGDRDRTFYWSEVSQASFYQIQVDSSVAHSFQAVLWKDTTIGSNAVVIHDLPERIWWRVRASNGCSTSVWSSPSVYAGVEATDYSDVPESFRLSQNYPNPFNSSTVIQFHLETQSEWNLAIYNILGEVVRRYSGVDPEGALLIEWGGDDGIGNPVPSGVYFYRLNTPNWSASKKMILLR